MQQLIAVGVGGFIGAVSRFVLVRWIQAAANQSVFPYGTLAVNVVGSFILGLLFQLWSSQSASGSLFRDFVLVGVLGAFTTFSAFSLETTNLLVKGESLAGSLNVIANVALCLLGVAAARLVVVGILNQ